HEQEQGERAELVAGQRLDEHDAALDHGGFRAEDDREAGESHDAQRHADAHPGEEQDQQGEDADKSGLGRRHHRLRPRSRVRARTRIVATSARLANRRSQRQGTPALSLTSWLFHRSIESHAEPASRATRNATVRTSPMRSVASRSAPIRSTRIRTRGCESAWVEAISAIAPATSTAAWISSIEP